LSLGLCQLSNVGSLVLSIEVYIEQVLFCLAS